MRKYYYKDAAGQQHGPLPIDKLKNKDLQNNTPVWYDPLPKWITAGEVDELKKLIAAEIPVSQIPVEKETPPVAANPGIVEQVAPVSGGAHTSAVPLATVTPQPIAKQNIEPAVVASPVLKQPARTKNTAWVSYVLSLLVLAGTGYFVYDDIQKNSGTENNVSVLGATSTTTTDVSDEGADEHADLHVVTTGGQNNSPDSISIAIAPVRNGSATSSADNKSRTDKPADAVKKAEADRKKQLTAQKQKAEQENRIYEAQQAALAKERQVRNNWNTYITIGKLNYMSNDGIEPFEVPVTNNTDVIVNKVTIRIDYIKKEGKDKVFQSETIVVTNIPPHATLNAKASGSRKGKKVNAFITAAQSSKLHFCYPQNNGDSSDPYFCN